MQPDDDEVGLLITLQLIYRWLLNELPQGDEFFIENALLTWEAIHFPLLIDPHKLAVTWIRSLKLRNNGQSAGELLETDFNDPNFKEKLKTAILHGDWIMFNDVHEVIDPAIVRLFINGLQKRTEVPWEDGVVLSVHKEFRIFLRTEVSHPKFDPLVFGFATVINFTVTECAMKDMFRGIVFGETTSKSSHDEERADTGGDCAIELESRYQMQRQRVLERQNRRSVAEEKLMSILSSCEGNLLDQAELVLQLGDVKEEIQLLEGELLKCVALHLELGEDRAREKNDCLARTATCLFFVLFNFKSVHVAYEFSLDVFIDVLRKIMRCEAEDEGNWDLAKVESELVWQVFRLGSLTILNKHFFAFVLQLTVRLQLLRGTISKEQVDFLINGRKSAMAGKELKEDLDTDELPDQVKNIFESVGGWRDLQSLVELFPKRFRALAEDIQQNADVWREWSMSEKLKEFPYDGVGDEGTEDISLTSFENLMLLRCFRADHLSQGVERYIQRVLGERFMTRPVIDLAAILKDYCNNDTPILFLETTQGFDALRLVRRVHSQSQVFRDSVLVDAAVGCTSENSLAATFQLAQTSGSWLIIANCHLSYSTLKRLQLWLKRDGVHANFRLFMTTLPTVPVNLLSRLIKVNTEHPKHLKSNLVTLFHQQIDDDMLQNVTSASTASAVPSALKQATMGQRCFRSIVYALTFFHVVALERRKYGKIGWNIEYGFNETELVMCIQMLATVLSKQQQNRLPWEMVKYMLGEIIYGSHIVDKFDRKLVAVFMDEYFNDFLFDEYQKFSFYTGEDFEYGILNYSSAREFLGELSLILIV